MAPVQNEVIQIFNSSKRIFSDATLLASQGAEFQIRDNGFTISVGSGVRPQGLVAQASSEPGAWIALVVSATKRVSFLSFDASFATTGEGLFSQAVLK